MQSPNGILVVRKVAQLNPSTHLAGQMQFTWIAEVKVLF